MFVAPIAPAPSILPPPDAHRSATVIYDRSYLLTPLSWTLRLDGPSVGGYGTLRNMLGGKYPTQEAADLAGRIFVATGIIPAHQDDGLRGWYSVEVAA